MNTLLELNILENKKVAWTLNLLTFPLFMVFAFIFSIIADNLAPQSLGDMVFSSKEALFFLPIIVLIMVVHELCHGLFFKLFQMDRPVKFGFSWKTLMAYAASPGSLYSRRQYAVISLAPFVILTTFFTLALLWGWMSYTAYVIFAGIHAAGCIGDLYYCYLIWVKFGKGKIVVEDTPVGMTIYQG